MAMAQGANQAPVVAAQQPPQPQQPQQPPSKKRRTVVAMATPFAAVVSKGVNLRYGNEGFVAEGAEQVPEILAARGAACLLSVLTPQECQAFRDGMLDSAELLSSGLPKPFSRDDPSTYGSIFELAPSHGGLFQHHAWGHAQCVWDLRQMEKLARGHAHCHKCSPQDMLVSFDGINFSAGARMPGRKRGQFRGNCWRHLDQRLSDSTQLGVQSWVTANDIGVGDATLRFLEGSHLLHGEFAKAFGLASETSDWHKLAPEQVAWFEERGCRDTCMTVPAGSQVYWDSRTVHSGIEFLPDTDCPPTDKPRAVRMVAYLCYEPRTGPVLPRDHPDVGKATRNLPRILAKRRRILDPSDAWFLRLASHWPNKMTLFGKTPRTYGGPQPAGCTRGNPAKYWSFVAPMPAPELTPFGRRVAGLD